MTTKNFWLRNWSRLVLIPILALAFFIAYIPHRDYAYPVHLDEWQVLTYTNQLVEQGNTNGLTNPISGGGQNSNQMGELGDHVFWGAFKEVTGIDWLAIFRYFPGVIYMFAVLGSYVLGERQGFGWQAALFVSLLPTTVGILGPAFLVPISLAMVFIPLALLTAFHLRGRWSYPLVSLLVVAPAAIHPPTAAVLVVILVPFILLSLKGNAKRGLGIALAVGLPFAALFPLIYRIAVPMVRRLFVPQQVSEYVDLPLIIPTLGYVIVLLCLLGVVYLAWKGRRTDYGLVLGTVALLGILAVFFTLHYGEAIVYYRGLQVAMLMVSILAGAGLMAVGSARFDVQSSKFKVQSEGSDRGEHRTSNMGRRTIPRFKVQSSESDVQDPEFKARNAESGDVQARHRTSNIGRRTIPPLAVVALVAVTLAIAIPARLNTPYYHMIDAEDYHAFTWIKQNVGDSYGKALLDPWKGMAFAGLAGKTLFSLTGEVADSNAQNAYQFLDGGSDNTTLLTENGISMVYSSYGSDSPDLVLVRKNVYLLQGN